MEIVRIQRAEDIPNVVEKAVAILRQGGVILYPTDTIYGLGADALSDVAVQKIYEIKGRDRGYSFLSLVANISIMETYAELTESSRRLAEKFLPGPLSLILKKRSAVTTGVGKEIDTIGLRIPDNALCLALTTAFGGPIASTSANKNGERTEVSVEKILEQLGENAHRIDLVIDAGALPPSPASTIVDISGDYPKIVREGAVAGGDILKMLSQ